MMKIIRWQGLAFFLVFVIMLSVIWFFLLGNLIERAIEKTGTKIVGAKVELEKVHVSLFPAGLTLRKLQVTDPKKPMTNAVDLEKGTFSLDTLNLLRRKVIIKNMLVEGVQFGTAREKSGALVRQEVSPEDKVKQGKRTEHKFKLPPLSIPSVREILEKEDLETVKLIEALRMDIRNERKNWKSRLNELPDSKKFHEYGDRIDDLTSKRKLSFTNVLQGVEELKSIRKDAKGDLQKVSTAKEDFSNELNELKKRFQDVQKAPAQDVQRLQKKYSLTTEGIENISELLFGPRISDTIERILIWHGRLQPILERVKLKGDKEEGQYDVSKPIRGKGVDVHYKEYEPLPDFLVRMINASLVLDAGNVSGKIRDVTPEQNITGAPLTFVFNGDDLRGMKSLKLEGVLDRTKLSQPEDTAVLHVTGYELKDITLSEDEELPIVLKKALVDLGFHLNLKGKAIVSNLTVDFTSSTISSTAKESTGALAKAFLSSLSRIRNFNLKVDATGTIEDYTLRLSSSLDRVLKNATGDEVKKQSARLKKKLESEIGKKVKDPMEELTKDIGALDGISGELDERLQQGGGLLKKMDRGALDNTKLLFSSGGRSVRQCGSWKLPCE